MYVDVGKVEVWDVGASRREQVVKMSEEVMEVFSIIDQHDITPDTAYEIFRECADVITATCNLVSMVARIAGAESGSLDFTGYMERCAEVQRERGRL